MDNGAFVDDKNDGLPMKIMIFHSYVKLPEG
jgi:hypothetical protein